MSENMSRDISLTTVKSNHQTMQLEGFKIKNIIISEQHFVPSFQVGPEVAPI